MSDEKPTTKARVDRIRDLTTDQGGSDDYYQAVSLGQSAIHDTAAIS